MHYRIESLDNAIEMLKYIQLDLLKESLETLGEDLEYNNNKVEYKNYLIENPITILEPVSGETMSQIFDGAVTPSNIPAATKANAMKVVTNLMNILGLTKEQACGIAGVLTSESGVNAGIVNKGEKNGTYKSSGANNEGTPYGTKHSPWSYGAGICQWTFCDRKEKAIMGGLNVSREEAKKIIMNQGIEGLSLEQQINMLAFELQTTYKATLAGIKKCTTPAQAAATFYCHNVAGFSTSTEPATQAEIDKMNARYGHVGANNQINKGMNYAAGLAQS